VPRKALLLVELFQKMQTTRAEKKIQWSDFSDSRYDSLVDRLTTVLKIAVSKKVIIGFRRSHGESQGQNKFCNKHTQQY